MAPSAAIAGWRAIHLTSIASSPFRLRMASPSGLDDLSIDTTFRTGAWGQYASNLLAPNRTGVTGIEVGPLIAVPEIK